MRRCGSPSKPGRQLVINDDARAACFSNAPVQSLGAGESHRMVSGARGSGSVVRRPRQAGRGALLLAAGPGGTRLSS